MLHNQTDGEFAKAHRKMDVTDEEEKVLQEIHSKLAHLSQKNRDAITYLIVRQNVIALSLQDLSPADVPYSLQLELTDEKPVNHIARRLSPKHNDIVQKELKEMLKARMITPFSSAWSFPVVIAILKDGVWFFCVDYRVLYQRMKADRFPLPKIQKIFGEFAEGVFFATLHLFSGYRPIKLEE